MGEERRAYFRAQAPASDVLLTEGAAVGTSFVVSIQPLNTSEDSELVNGTLVSDDPDVFVVADEGRASAASVTAVGPGQTYLSLVVDDEVQDRLPVRAAQVGQVHLLDMSNAGSNVDARLPERFGLVDGESVKTMLRLEDSCGGTLHAPGVISASASEPTALDVVETDEGFEIRALAEGGADVILDVAGTEVRYDVDVVRSVDVDTVFASIASTTETSAQLWGRARAGNVEVVGMSYAWSASPRVRLSESIGAWTTAAILQPPEDASADWDPAKVKVELFGIESELDLFAATVDDVQPGRVQDDAAAEDPVAPTAGGCAGGDGNGGCDPYLAFALFGAWSLRKRLRGLA